MDVLFYYHDTCVKHNPGEGHPERPERLCAIHRHLLETGILDRMQIKIPKAVGHELLRAVHDSKYVDHVLSTSGESVVFDPDTRTSPESVDAALLAAGAAVDAVDMVYQGNTTAFCAVRPPGHHAESHRAMGFCLFNSAAVAAQYALDKHNAERVLIFDPDVHHGNGTQNIFYESNRVCYVSIHQSPLFPGTGRIEEQGRGKGLGFNVNLPLPSGMADAEYHYLTQTVVTNVIERFAPQLIIFSAGFDAHTLDPLGGMNVSSEGFVQLYSPLVSKARNCEIPYLFLLEGGYSLQGLTESVSLLLQALLDDHFPSPCQDKPNPLVYDLVKKVPYGRNIR